jgi:hypothetical protein
MKKRTILASMMGAAKNFVSDATDELCEAILEEASIINEIGMLVNTLQVQVLLLIR